MTVARWRRRFEREGGDRLDFKTPLIIIAAAVIGGEAVTSGGRTGEMATTVIFEILARTHARNGSGEQWHAAIRLELSSPASAMLCRPTNIFLVRTAPSK